MGVSGKHGLLEIVGCALDGKKDEPLGPNLRRLLAGKWRVRAEVVDELRKVLNGDRRRWPDARKRDLDKPERRKRRAE
jgi:hypothetical protein